MLYVYPYKDLCSLRYDLLQVDGHWVAARPLQWQGWWNNVYRFQAAWEVFRGRADAFTWPGGQ